MPERKVARAVRRYAAGGPPAPPTASTASVDLLHRLARMLLTSYDTDAILREVARTSAELMEVDGCIIRLLEPDGRLTARASHGVELEYLQRTEVRLGEGLSGLVASQKRPIEVRRLADDPRPVARKLLLELGYVSYLGMPLIGPEDNVLGVLGLISRDERPFEPQDIALASAFAGIVSVAIRNATLLASLNRRVLTQLALIETTAALHRAIDSAAIYDIVADRLTQLVPFEAFSFYTVDWKTKMVTPVLARGQYAEQVLADRFTVDEGVTGAVARSGRGEVVPDVDADPRAASIPGTPESHETMLAVPLMGREKALGVLVGYRSPGRTFTPEELETATLFANQAALALENASLYRIEQRLSKASQRRVERVAKIFDIVTSMLYIEDLDQLLERVVRIVVETFGFARAAIVLKDETREVYLPRALWGFTEEQASELRSREIPWETIELDFSSQFVVGKASYYVPMEKSTTPMSSYYFVAHPERASLPRESPEHWHELDAMHFVLNDREGRMIGYLFVDEPLDGKIPTRETIEAIELFASIASIAIVNVRLHDAERTATKEVAVLSDVMFHDLTSYVQGILGNIELVLHDGGVDPAVRGRLEAAFSQLLAIGDLVRSVRKLAQVREAEVGALHRTDLAVAIRLAILDVLHQYPERTVRVRFDEEEGTYMTIADGFLKDVFAALLANAVKFDDHDRVEIDIDISPVAPADRGHWLVEVLDRGRGIPDERKEQIFRRFEGSPSGLKGSGVGLHIARTLMERYRGRIWVEDRIKGDPSRGAAFKLLFPRTS